MGIPRDLPRDTQGPLAFPGGGGVRSKTARTSLRIRTHKTDLGKAEGKQQQYLELSFGTPPHF